MWGTLQKARVIVAMAPNFPDIIKILEAIERAYKARLRGEGSALARAQGSA